MQKTVPVLAVVFASLFAVVSCAGDGTGSGDGTEPHHIAQRDATQTLVSPINPQPDSGTRRHATQQPSRMASRPPAGAPTDGATTTSPSAVRAQQPYPQTPTVPSPATTVTSAAAPPPPMNRPDSRRVDGASSPVPSTHPSRDAAPPTAPGIPPDTAPHDDRIPGNPAATGVADAEPAKGIPIDLGTYNWGAGDPIEMVRDALLARIARNCVAADASLPPDCVGITEVDVAEGPGPRCTLPRTGPNDGGYIAYVRMVPELPSSGSVSPVTIASGEAVVLYTNLCVYEKGSLEDSDDSDIDDGTTAAATMTADAPAPTEESGDG
jgi:hypothetical protein